jgi:hypothetical protein
MAALARLLSAGLRGSRLVTPGTLLTWPSCQDASDLVPRRVGRRGRGFLETAIDEVEQPSARPGVRVDAKGGRV